MVDIFQHAQDTIGLSGVLKVIDALDEQDKVELEPDILRSVPNELIHEAPESVRLGLISAMSRLVRSAHSRQLVLLGTDTTLIEVTAGLQIDISLDVLTSPSLSSRDTAVVSNSMPENLRSVVHPAGVLPLDLPMTSTVIAVALRASEEQLLISDTAAQMLGALRGMRFLGDLHAISPFDDRYFTAPPRGWRTISNSEFRSITTPEYSLKFPARI